MSNQAVIGRRANLTYLGSFAKEMVGARGVLVVDGSDRVYKVDHIVAWRFETGCKAWLNRPSFSEERGSTVTSSSWRSAQ